jgi:hypothetical protein
MALPGRALFRDPRDDPSAGSPAGLSNDTRPSLRRMRRKTPVFLRFFWFFAD